MSQPSAPAARPSLDIGGLLRWAWELFRANWGYLVASTAVTGLLGLVLLAAGYAVYIVRLADTGFFSTDTTTTVDGWAVVVAYGLMLLVLLVGTLLTSWITVNYVRGAMLLVDGGRPRVRSLLRPVRVLPAMGFTLLITLGSLLGYLLCFVGAIVFSFGTMFAVVALADGASPTASIGRSIRLVRANLGTAALLYLVSLALFLVGYLACGVGLLVAGPLSLLMVIGAYRWLSELEEADPAATRG